MLMIILGTVAIAALLYYYLIKPFSYWKNRGVEQGKTTWFFGDNWGVSTGTQSFPEMVQMLYNNCPGKRYSGGYQFFLPTLILKDPELIKQITIKDFDHFTDHRKLIDPSADPLWGKNLFSLTGQNWRDMRSILSPSFTSSKMKSMFVLMSECGENFIQHFLKKDEDIITIDMKDTFTRYTNDVIATTAFGVMVDSLAEPNNEFYVMGKEATTFASFKKRMKFMGYFLIPNILKWFKITLFSKEVRSFFMDLIDDTIKTREEKGIVRPDMINLLMEARKGIHRHEEIDNSIIDTGFATALESNAVSGQETRKSAKDLTLEDIAAQAFIFFVGGFESVSTLMCFSSYELAVHPDIQNTLRKEIQETLKECKGKLTYEALLKMKYMDMVISESLRKWPAAVALDRVCTKPYTIQPATPGEKPLHLEKGSVVWVPVFGIHYDPEYYPDPERFDPERFNDENKGNINPYTYIPFGLGPRNCIGSRFALLEAKAVLFHLLSHFELVPVEKTRIPLKLDRKSFNITAEGGFWFGLKRIHK